MEGKSKYRNAKNILHTMLDHHPSHTDHKRITGSTLIAYFLYADRTKRQAQVNFVKNTSASHSPEICFIKPHLSPQKIIFTSSTVNEIPFETSTRH